ncbi:hypothetical protein E2L08_02070 [Palleronia sediminis]|uniref:Uncharacterized protein n=1 Tax=Palleronia sediminis TaxID=2547833 RepID=A0A4R6AQG5_9RHOB|nr:hypothetical protein [Palleronia sediminis]TDL84276.1 hypothetical protein E2L08_02070 [Palleronia sediminis]
MTAEPFDVVVIGQKGRVGYEAILFAASLRRADPGFAGRLIVAEPRPGGAWPGDPRMSDAQRDLLAGELCAEIRPFDAVHFGAAYPQGNKIEALAALDPGAPFVFFDSDTLVTGPLSAVPFDFDRPCASLRREGTWPEIEFYGPGYSEIWGSLYDLMGLDFASSLDPDQPDEYWERYLYFNAGWFFYRCGPSFGRRYLETALAIRDRTPRAAELQSLDPWLDQVALPLVVHALGGGRRTIPEGLLDGSVTCHWRVMGLLFARESDAAVTAALEAIQPNRIKKVLKEHEPFRRFLLQGRGARARAMFDRAALPRRERAIRNRLKSAGLWMR